MWESKVNIGRVFELRCRTIDYFGVGAIKKIHDIVGVLKSRYGVDRVILVTGRRSYKISGAWDHVKQALEEHGVEYVLYDKVSSNSEAPSKPHKVCYNRSLKPRK